MPVLTEAATIAAGRIIKVEQQYVTEQDSKTGKWVTHYDRPDGVRVLVGCDDGDASVKLNPERERDLAPQFGQTVAWFVRGGASTKGKPWTAFVREVTPDDVAKLGALVGK